MFLTRQAMGQCEKTRCGGRFSEWSASTCGLCLVADGVTPKVSTFAQTECYELVQLARLASASSPHIAWTIAVT